MEFCIDWQELGWYGTYLYIFHMDSLVFSLSQAVVFAWELFQDFSQLQAALRLSVKDQHVTQLVIESSDEEVGLMTSGMVPAVGVWS